MSLQLSPRSLRQKGRSPDGLFHKDGSGLNSDNDDAERKIGSPERARFERGTNFGKTQLKALRGVTRAAVFALLVRVAFGVVKTILRRGLAKGILAALRDEIFSKNPLKWAALMAGVASFRGIQQLLLHIPYFPKEISSFVAGALSSLPILVMNVSTRTELSLYLGIRAMHGVLVSAVMPSLPQYVQEFKHYEVLALTLSSLQIFYAFVFEPDTHSPGYLSFLLRASMKDKRFLDSIGGYSRRLLDPATVDWLMEKGLPIPKGPVDTRMLCDMHPGYSCVGNHVVYILKHLMNRSLPLYVPLKIVTAILFNPKRCWKHPAAAIRKAATGITNSSLFLSFYCVAPFVAVCIFAKARICSPILLAVLSALLIVPSAYLEPRSRRLDLALYCCMHAARSLILLLAKKNVIQPPNRYHVLLLQLFSVGYIFHQFDRDPKSLHRNIRSGLCWLLREPHHPPKHRTHSKRVHLHNASALEEPAVDVTPSVE